MKATAAVSRVIAFRAASVPPSLFHDVINFSTWAAVVLRRLLSRYVCTAARVLGAAGSSSQLSGPQVSLDRFTRPLRRKRSPLSRTTSRAVIGVVGSWWSVGDHDARDRLCPAVMVHAG
jgi:hypothetical protein